MTNDATAVASSTAAREDDPSPSSASSNASSTAKLTMVQRLEGAGVVMFPRRLGTEMCEVLPRLYLGSLRDAVDEHQLEKYDIRHVVSVHDLTPTTVPSQRRVISYLRIRLSDSATADIAAHFAETNTYIHAKRLDPHGGSVLVHCLAGVSRSATVVAAYLMAAAEMKPVARVLGHLSARRPCVNPNLGFRLQLAKYEKAGASRDGDVLRGMIMDRRRFEELRRADMEALKLKRKTDLSRVGDWRRLFKATTETKKESSKHGEPRRSSEGTSSRRESKRDKDDEDRKELKRSFTATSAFVDALKNVSFIDEL